MSRGRNGHSCVHGVRRVLVEGSRGGKGLWETHGRCKALLWAAQLMDKAFTIFHRLWGLRPKPKTRGSRPLLTDPHPTPRGTGTAAGYTCRTPSPKHMALCTDPEGTMDVSALQSCCQTNAWHQCPSFGSGGCVATSRNMSHNLTIAHPLCHQRPPPRASGITPRPLPKNALRPRRVVVGLRLRRPAAMAQCAPSGSSSFPSQQRGTAGHSTDFDEGLLG